MSRYRVASEAREDLKSIYRYIAKENPRAAGRLREVFYDKFRLLARHPLMGEGRDDLAPKLRMFPVGSYVLLYRPAQDGVDIVQTVHSAREITALFGPVE